MITEKVKMVYRELVELGYDPIIVGTYALVLQGWLPVSYLNETKDVDIYVGETMVVFNEELEKKIRVFGYSLGRTDSGGLYVDMDKPIEIIYPVFDFYIPVGLLKYYVFREGMKVLEAHAVLVAKSLGGGITELIGFFKEMGVVVDLRKLYNYLEIVSKDKNVGNFLLVKKRVDEFVEKLRDEGVSLYEI